MDNRTNILDCALRLFATQGVDAVGVQKIAETAGVTKPTLYYYFKSKHGLLQALLEEYFGRLHAMVEPVARYHGDLSLSLTSVTTAYFSFAKTNGDFYRLQLSLYFAPPQHAAHKIAAPFQERQYYLLENIFSQAAADFQSLHVQYDTLIFLGMIDHWISLALNGYVTLDSTLVHRTVHQFFYGLQSSPGVGDPKPFPVEPG